MARGAEAGLRDRGVPPEPGVSRVAWTLLLLLALAAALRFAWLGAEELWLDEAQTVSAASRDLPSLGRTFAPPALYWVVLRSWLALFGAGEVALRSLSALFGVLTVPALYALARGLVGEAAARWAALFAAVTPLAVFYAREGRAYAMLSFLGLVAVWSLERALTGAASGRYQVVHALSVLAGTYTHYLGALLLPVNVLQVALSGRRAEPRRWAFSLAIVVAGLLPWPGLASRELAGASSALGWLAPFWEAYPPALAVPRTLLALLPGGAVPPFVGLRTIGALQVPLALAGVALAAATFWPGENRWLARVPPGARGLAAVYCFVPLGLMFVYSWRIPVYAVGRSDFLVFPAFCLLAGIGVARIRPWSGRALALALFGVAAGTTLAAYYTAPVRVHERVAYRALASRVERGDVVICTDLTRPTAEYYLGRAVPGLRFASYPAELAAHPAFIDRKALAADPGRLAADAAALVPAVATAQTAGRRVLLLYVDTPVNRYLRDRLEAEFTVTPVEQPAGFRLNQVGGRVRVLFVERRA